MGYNGIMTNQLGSQQNNEPDWVVVYTTAVFPEAHIIFGRLQSEGIEAYIHTQPGASAMGITLGTFGGISVLVRPADYDVAMELLHGEDDFSDDDLLPDTTDEQVIIWDDDDEE
jgi:hypothetical protein